MPDPLPTSTHTPPTPAPAPVPQARNGRRFQKRWLLLLLCLGGLGTAAFVPVGNIPLLRNLVYAMGYSPDEAKGLSLLKALFSWNDHAKRVQGEKPAPDELSVFGSSTGLLTASAAQAQNKLINLRSVNAALARRGRAGDLLSGSYTAPPSEQTQNPDVRIAKTNATATTQANQVKAGEVFFGEDASILVRDKNDGYNSVNTLKKLANKNVAGASLSKGDDWFMRAVDRASRTELDMASLTKDLDKSGTALFQMGNIGNLSDSRAKRDLYYAWLTGRAARRTQHVVLKKTLAAAGFSGAELPRTVFTSSGFSGVAIKPDDMLADMESVKKYAELDKQCAEAMQRGSEMSDLTTVQNQITGLKNNFPATCGDRNSDFPNTLNAIANSCAQMRSVFENVQRGCASLSINLQPSQCKAEKLTAYYTSFDEFCQAKERACEKKETPEEQEACKAQVAAEPSKQEYAGADGSVWDGNKLEYEINATFYDGNQLNIDYFPGVNWGSSFWVDENAAN